ncbi:MAG: RluA family pseudouridine synthase [Phycisphaerales bacterium]
MNGSAQTRPGESIRIVLEHPRFVVIDKPAGMLSVPGRSPDHEPCACAHVARLFPNASGPMICHRLDQATSGLLVFALDPDAQRFLSLQFQRRRAIKRYIALLRGRPSGNRGTIELPLRTDWPRRPRQMVDFVHGKQALTHWRTLDESAPPARGEVRTRVEFCPITGKTHQLRVHAAWPAEQGGLGCPIVGDVLYDPDHPAERLMLHASELTITDPDTLQRVTVHAPPPF